MLQPERACLAGGQRVVDRRNIDIERLDRQSVVNDIHWCGAARRVHTPDYVVFLVNGLMSAHDSNSYLSCGCFFV